MHAAQHQSYHYIVKSPSWALFYSFSCLRSDALPEYLWTNFPSSRAWLVSGKLASIRSQKSWMPVSTLFSLIAYQPNAFLAFSLPLPSHHLFPPFLVVGPHRSLLSPGPLVTINNQQFIFMMQCLHMPWLWNMSSIALFLLLQPVDWEHLIS